MPNPNTKPFSGEERKAAGKWLCAQPGGVCGLSPYDIVCLFQRELKRNAAVVSAAEDFLDHQGNKREPEKWKVLREKVSALQAEGGGNDDA